MNQLLMMMISTLSHLLTCTNTSISSAKSANSLGIILAMKQQSELQKLIDNTTNIDPGDLDQEQQNLQ